MEFLPGDEDGYTRMSGNITIFDDDVLEGEHSFTVSISPGYYEIGGRDVLTVVIVDNDGKKTCVV